MDRARDELLAGAVLAQDEHLGLGAGDAPHGLRQCGGRRALADHAVLGGKLPALRAEGGVLPPEVTKGERALDREQQALGGPWLLEKVVGAELDRLDRALDRGVAGDHDHGQVGVAFPEPLEGAQPIETRHLDIEEDEIRGRGLEASRELGPVGQLVHLIAAVAKGDRHLPAEPGMVIDDQDGGCRLAHRAAPEAPVTARTIAVAAPACGDGAGCGVSGLAAREGGPGEGRKSASTRARGGMVR